MCYGRRCSCSQAHTRLQAAAAVAEPVGASPGPAGLLAPEPVEARLVPAPTWCPLSAARGRRSSQVTEPGHRPGPGRPSSGLRVCRRPVRRGWRCREEPGPCCRPGHCSWPGVCHSTDRRRWCGSQVLHHCSPDRPGRRRRSQRLCGCSLRQRASQGELRGQRCQRRPGPSAGTERQPGCRHRPNRRQEQQQRRVTGRACRGNILRLCRQCWQVNKCACTSVLPVQARLRVLLLA